MAKIPKGRIIFIGILFSMLLGPISAQDLVYSNNGKLYTPQGDEFTIRGIVFSNGAWDNATTPPRNHHGAEDFRYIKELGFNTVELYLSHRYFYSNGSSGTFNEAGFRWLEQNIQWARDNSIYLILGLHNPPGGSQAVGNTNGDALWNNPANQRTMTRLWQEIARRYNDQEVILGYNLLNDPLPTRSINQWENLAGTCRDAIRSQGDQHLIILDRAPGLSQGWRDDIRGDGSMNFISLDDDNIMLRFTFFQPQTFTNQGLEWSGFDSNARFYYPNPTQYDMEGTWQSAQFNNMWADTNERDWQYIEGEIYRHSNLDYQFTKLIFQFKNLGPEGRCQADDITIKVWNPQGELSYSRTYNMEQLKTWRVYRERPGGEANWSSSVGRTGAGLFAEGITADGNLSPIGNAIPLEEGYSYQISGWVRCQNLTSDSQVTFRLDFYSSEVEMLPLNRQYLQQEMGRFQRVAEEMDLPLYMGAYSCSRYSFEDNLGGDRWVRDVNQNADELGIHRSFFSYHDWGNGLYQNHANEAAREQNQLLADLFREINP